MNRRELQKYKDSVKNATSNFSRHTEDIKKDANDYMQRNKIKSEEGVLVEPDRISAMSVEESDKIFGTTSFAFHNKEELKAFKEEIDYALENHDTSALSEAGIFDVPAMIGAMLGYLTGKYTLEYKMILGQAKEINDMYAKIEALLQSNKVIRYKHRKDRISCKFSNVLLAKNAKMYHLVLSALGFDPDYLSQRIDAAIIEIDNTSGDKMKFAKQIADGIVLDYQATINKYHPELDGYIPIVRETTYNNVPLEQVIRIQKRSFAVEYSNIYAFNRTLSNQAVYLKSLQQEYAVYKNRYKGNKPAMHVIDTVFSAILKWQNDSMTFNTKCMDACSAAYKNHYDELVKIYDYLKQYA